MDLEKEERQEKIGGGTRSPLEEESMKLIQEKKQAQYGRQHWEKVLGPQDQPARPQEPQPQYPTPQTPPSHAPQQPPGHMPGDPTRPRPPGSEDITQPPKKRSSEDDLDDTRILDYKKEKEEEDEEQMTPEEVGIMASASKYPYLNLYRGMKIEKKAGSPWFVLQNNGKVVAIVPATHQAQRSADHEAQGILQDVARIGLVAALKRRGGRVAQASDPGVVGGGVRDFISLTDPATDQSVGARPDFDTQSKRTQVNQSPVAPGERVDHTKPHISKSLTDAVRDGRTTDYAPKSDVTEPLNVTDRQDSDMRQKRPPKTVADPVIVNRQTDMRSASRNPWLIKAQMQQERGIYDPNIKTLPRTGPDPIPKTMPGISEEEGRRPPEYLPKPPPGQIPGVPEPPKHLPIPGNPSGGIKPLSASRNPWVHRAAIEEYDDKMKDMSDDKLKEEFASTQDDPTFSKTEYAQAVANEMKKRNLSASRRQSIARAGTVLVSPEDFNTIVADLETRIAKKIEQKSDVWKKAFSERLVRAMMLAADRKRLNQEPCELKTAFGDVLDSPSRWSIPIDPLDGDAIYSVIEAAFASGGPAYTQALVRQAMKFIDMPQEAFLSIEADTKKLQPVDIRLTARPDGDEDKEEKEEKELPEHLDKEQYELDERRTKERDMREEREDREDREREEKESRRRRAAKGNMILAPSPEAGKAGGSARHPMLRQALANTPLVSKFPKLLGR